MPILKGTYPIGGPILDISGGFLTPTTKLRDHGVILCRAGKIWRVNAAASGWEIVPGHVIASAAPAAVFEGLLWYDTTLKVLKHYNGTAFVAVATAAATTASIGDNSVTPPNLDSGDATKQDAFLARLNALRRDLKNMAALSPSEQRAALSGLGSIIEGGRQIPSADFAGRVWIDGTNDQAYICRNNPELTKAVRGGFADAVIPNTVEIAESVGDLATPTMLVAAGLHVRR